MISIELAISVSSYIFFLIATIGGVVPVLGIFCF